MNGSEKDLKDLKKEEIMVPADEPDEESGTIELDENTLDMNSDLQKLADELGGEHAKAKEKRFFGRKNKDSESIKKIEKLLESVKEKDDRIKELENSLKMMVAENRNQKTRIENEFRAKIKFAVEDFFRDFITVKDDFDKAMDFAPKTEESANDPFIQGIKHLLSKTESIMKKFGLESYSGIGMEFDPSLHQAMSIINVEGKAQNEIVAEYVRGYKYNDRILRPSMVIVASGVNPEVETEKEKPADETADMENSEQ
ncbi:MAG TPA: nucleotide exchange factor GrpE [bacterium]|nr:nucleotide exchange factor GrpE [bacterium]HPS30912.1 nucleotide exchange factor GrpE [bacterium]